MPSTTTVYTAIFGKYDNLLEIPEEFIESGVDYICFTDDPLLKSSTFKIIVINDQEMSPSRSNRNFKINVGLMASIRFTNFDSNILFYFGNTKRDRYYLLRIL